jgi:hypothetical protein
VQSTSETDSTGNAFLQRITPDALATLRSVLRQMDECRAGVCRPDRATVEQTGASR